MPEPRLRAIVGLGNPGAEYALTRHNAGFWFADALADGARASFRVEPKFRGELARIKLAGSDVLLLKPATFMNRSGESVQPLCAYFKIAPEDLLIAHDELDLPAGTARLKLGGGHGGHNGLRSLHQHLGEGYRRLRIGIGHPGTKEQVLGYVLGRAPAAEDKLIRAGIAAAIDVLPIWFSESWDKALQQLHSQPAP